MLCNQSLGEGAPLDELLDGIARARRDGAWTPDAASESRRRSLLPRWPAPSWDALLRSTAHRQALDLLARL